MLIGGEQSVGGQEAIETLCWVYSHWIPKSKIITTNTWSSELSKLVSHCHLIGDISKLPNLQNLHLCFRLLMPSLLKEFPV